MSNWFYLQYLKFLLLVNRIQFAWCCVKCWWYDCRLPNIMKGQDFAIAMVGSYVTQLTLYRSREPNQSATYYCDKLQDYLIDQGFYVSVNRVAFRQIAESILKDLETKDSEEIIAQDVTDRNYANRILGGVK